MTATKDEVRARLGHLNIRWLERNGWAVVRVEPDAPMAIAAKDALSDNTIEDAKAAAWDAMRAYRAMVNAGRVTAEE